MALSTWSLRTVYNRWSLPHKPEIGTYLLCRAVDSGLRRNDELTSEKRQPILGFRMVRPLAIASVLLFLLAACSVVVYPEAPATAQPAESEAQLLATATAVAPSAPEMRDRLAQECRRYGNCDEPTHWDALVLALEQRPLQLPELDPGDACQNPLMRTVEGYDFEVIGQGPVYSLGYLSSLHTHGTTGYTHDGWHWNKVVWARDPQYRGPIVIRGRQLDGPASLRFQWIREGDPSPELAHASLHVPPYSPGISRLTDGAGQWEEMMTYVVVRVPGCYGVQIDGVDFSTTIVFAVHGS